METYYNNNDIEELNDALLSIPIRSVEDYATWFSIMSGYKDGGGDYYIFDNWSRGGTKYNAKENAIKWESIQGNAENRATKSVVFYYAKMFGWKPKKTYKTSNYTSFNKPLDFDGVIVDTTAPTNQVKNEVVEIPTENTAPRLNISVSNVDYIISNEESREDTIAFLQALFNPQDYIAIITNSINKKSKWEPLPSNEEHYKLEFVVDNINAFYEEYYNNGSHQESGVWLRVNPMEPTGGKDSNVAQYKHVLVECDDLPPQQQINLMYALNLPITTLVYSGNKSFHAIVKVEADTIELYRERVSYIYSVCIANGLVVDTSCKNPSRMTRLGGVKRGEQAQQLIATNIGAQSYREWVEWVERHTQVEKPTETENEPTGDQMEPQEAQASTEQARKKLKIVNVKDYINSGDYRSTLTRLSKYKNRKTGYKNLDKHLTLYPSLLVFGGSASVGKTTFAVNLADNLANQGETILFFTLEQTEQEIVNKQIAKELYIKQGANALSNLRIKNGETTPQLQAIEQATANSRDNFYIIPCNFELNADNIVEVVEDYIANTGTKPIIIIDYLQLLSAPPHLKNDERQKVEYNLKRLKAYQIQQELLIILISNVNRGSYQSSMEYDSFKESGLIEHTADTILGLQLAVFSNPNYLDLTDKKKSDRQAMIGRAQKEQPKIVEVVGLKNRNGIQRFSAYFKYHTPHDYFEPIEDPFNR